MADGLPKMVCLIGIPEITFISPARTPNCCNFSMPSEVGSTSSNMARSVIVSGIIGPLFTQGHSVWKHKLCPPCGSHALPVLPVLPRQESKESDGMPPYTTAGTERRYLSS